MEDGTEEILNAKVTYACVLRGPYRNFLELEKHIKQNPDIHLVYSKTSAGYLWICKDTSRMRYRTAKEFKKEMFEDLEKGFSQIRMIEDKNKALCKA